MQKTLSIILIIISILLLIALYILSAVLKTDKMYLIIHLIGYIIIILCPIGLYLFHKNKN